MASIFTKIIHGDIPAYKVAENDHFLAFLDISPQRPGHTLVVPKIEVDKFFDVPDEFLREWLVFAKPIAKAIESAFECDRCGISVIGLEVPHAHMHLIPISTSRDMAFVTPGNSATKDELLEAQKKILAAMNTGETYDL